MMHKVLATPVITGIAVSAVTIPISLFMVGMALYQFSGDSVSAVSALEFIFTNVSIFSLFSMAVLFVPPALGSILLYLGFRLKVNGDTVNGYGLPLGMGGAIITGHIAALSAIILS